MKKNCQKEYAYHAANRNEAVMNSKELLILQADTYQADVLATTRSR